MHGIESEVNADIAFLDRSALYMPDEIPNPRRARYEMKSSWSSRVDTGNACYPQLRLREFLSLAASVTSFIQPQNVNFA